MNDFTDLPHITISRDRAEGGNTLATEFFHSATGQEIVTVQPGTYSTNTVTVDISRTPPKNFTHFRIWSQWKTTNPKHKNLRSQFSRLLINDNTEFDPIIELGSLFNEISTDDEHWREIIEEPYG